MQNPIVIAHSWECASGPRTNKARSPAPKAFVVTWGWRRDLLKLFTSSDHGHAQILRFTAWGVKTTYRQRPKMMTSSLMSCLASYRENGWGHCFHLPATKCTHSTHRHQHPACSGLARKPSALSPCRTAPVLSLGTPVMPLFVNILHLRLSCPPCITGFTLSLQPTDSR